MIDSVCVFCGSRFGNDAVYQDVATRLAEQCAASDIEIVYGGGDVGLMGVVADTAIPLGGRVTGFIPERLLEREVGHRGITELVVTNDMFDRKAQMIARSDAFVVLPGGLGTLDELLEVLTLRQLGYHAKPIVIVDTGGYWKPFLDTVERIVGHGFADPGTGDLFTTVTRAEDVLPTLGVRQPAPAAAG